ncbi:BNR-4 repeat-containing protein [Bacteroidales bacterium OttesenSCG-928-M06]|nr:BNR-4 repeat-containing protein [Bacteroidales bacterium OttesenSCG-928-M06]
MKQKQRYFLVLFVFVLGIIGIDINIFAESTVDKHITLTEDGAWCWFADPRAVYYKGEKEQTYFAWVNSSGDIVAASYNHQTDEYLEKVIHAKLEVDDHDVPAILIREDGHIVVFYSKHQASGPMQRVISTNPEDISSFSTSYTWGSNVSYPNPFQVGDSICLLYRGINWHPTIAVSTDDGKTFSDVRQLVLNGGARPYARYCQSADGSIHVAVTTGHPRDELKNKIFYFRLKDNKFYRADGTKIKDFTEEGIDLGDTSGTKSEAEIVYNGTDNGKGWIWDITIDPETQYPVMVYASFPTDSDHRYNYAYWDGEKWVNKEIVKSGKWFPQTPAGTTEREKNYSGGLSMDHENPWTVYLSKQVNGVFEIFKYETEDKGKNWEITPITENSPSDIVNVRPIVPRNHKEGYFDVLWMRGTYGYYLNDFNTSLVFQMRDKKDDIKKVTLNKKEIELLVGEEEALTVILDPIIGNNKFVWTSSNEDVAVVEDGIVKGISIGTADITVKTVNDKTETCKVTVTEQTYLKEAFFDFGTDKSPVAEGAIRITENSLLKGAYGWLNNLGIESRYRGATYGDEKGDFNMYSSPAIFKVYVENGNYDITVVQGDGGTAETPYKHGKMSIKLNGTTVASGISTPANKFHTSTFSAKIEENVMEFEFSTDRSEDKNWVVNSIKIVPDLTSISVNEQATDMFHPEAWVTVYDLLGNKLAEEFVGDRDCYSFLKENNLSRGTYILKINKDNKIKVLKVFF